MKTQSGHSIASIISFSAPAFAFVVALTIGLVFGPIEKSAELQEEAPKTKQGDGSKGASDPKEGEPQEEKSQESSASPEG